MFILIWALGVLYVVAEGIAAYFDGFLTQEQIAENYNYRHAYSFMEHGGMWCDITFLPLIFAMILSKYKFEYLSWQSFVSAGICIGMVIYANYQYRHNVALLPTPESGQHDGKVTVMGRMHGIYAIIGIWTYLLLYFCPVHPVIKKEDLIIATAGLLVLFPVGVIKFNPDWHWRTTDTVTTAVSYLVTIIAFFWKYQYCR